MLFPLSLVALLSLPILLTRGACAAANPLDPVGNSYVPSLQSNKDTTVSFQVPYWKCDDGSDLELSFELNIRGASQTCAGWGMFLNGVELSYDGKGPFASGSDTIYSYLDGTELRVNWQNTCVSAPPDASHERAAQILTVNINRVGEVPTEDDFGFTLSFTRLRRPEILRFSKTPINLSDDDLDIDCWLKPGDTDRLENWPVTGIIENGPPLEKTEFRGKGLQGLGAQVLDLHRQTAGKEHQIHIPLQHSSPREDEQANPLKSFARRAEASMEEDSHTESTWDDRFKDHAVPPPRMGITLSNEVKAFFRNGAVILLIVAIGALLFRIFRNTTQCQRRRAELATKREERRKRRAYKFAARRLRWKRWWEGRSRHESRSNGSAYDLEELGYAEQPRQPDTESDGNSEQETMPSEIPEILGLRRALEFVGELVRNGDCGAERSPGSQRYPLPTRDASAHSAPSSVVGLTTVYSSRASSLSSLDTTSSLTLDTLETAETQPPPPYQA